MASVSARGANDGNVSEADRRTATNNQLLPCCSALPEPLESIRGKLGVADRVLDILVPEVVLQRARVLAVVGKFVAAGVTQHVAKPRGYRALVGILELAGAK